MPAGFGRWGGRPERRGSGGGPGGGEASQGEGTGAQMRWESINQRVTNPERGHLGPGPPGVSEGRAVNLWLSVSTDRLRQTSGRDVWYRLTNLRALPPTCPGAPASRGCEHTRLQILPSIAVLHGKEPGLLGDMTDGSKSTRGAGDILRSRKQKKCSDNDRDTAKDAETS